MERIRFTFESVELKTENTLVFIGVRTPSDSPMYLEFYGSISKENTSYIPEKCFKKLDKKLKEDYGYAPFDENSVFETFENNHTYLIEF